MSALAPTMQRFFIERLARQRQASPHTIAAYRDTFRLLICYAHTRTGKAASNLDLADLDAPLIAAFLDHLEHDRHNSVRTRNARLAAIHSLFRYAALQHPEHAEMIARVLAIPTKKHDRALINYLTGTEVDALLAAADRTHWLGRRDHALLTVAVQCGLRVSELAGLHCRDVHLGPSGYLNCHGKGRKERITPLTTSTVTLLKTWLAERQGQPDDPLFPTTRGTPLSTDAVAKLVAKHAARAAHTCPSLAVKTVTPHTLRHTTAMALLHAGVDTTVIALWLGHEQIETTAIYLHADLTIKEQALARIETGNTPLRRYHAPDSLIAFLESL